MLLHLLWGGKPAHDFVRHPHRFRPFPCSGWISVVDCSSAFLLPVHSVRTDLPPVKLYPAVPQQMLLLLEWRGSDSEQNSCFPQYFCCPEPQSAVPQPYFQLLPALMSAPQSELQELPLSAAQVPQPLSDAKRASSAERLRAVSGWKASAAPVCHPPAKKRPAAGFVQAMHQPTAASDCFRLSVYRLLSAALRW